MKFSGNLNRNFSSANGSRNLDYQKDVILDEVAKLIEYDTPTVIATLKDAGYYNVSPTAPRKEIINIVVDALYRSEQFRHDIAVLVAKTESGNKFSNGEGTAAEAGKDIKLSGGIISAIGGVLESGFGVFKSAQDRKAEEERTRQQMYDKLLAGEKTNWVPIIVIGGVFLIGGIIAFVTLRNKG